jgi:hypothetical protein
MASAPIAVYTKPWRDCTGCAMDLIDAQLAEFRMLQHKHAPRHVVFIMGAHNLERFQRNEQAKIDAAMAKICACPCQSRK